MKAYQEKESGMWKWGTNGKAIFPTKQKAQNYGLQLLTDALMKIRNKLNGAMERHGK